MPPPVFKDMAFIGEFLFGGGCDRLVHAPT